MNSDGKKQACAEEDPQSRTRLLLGSEAVDALRRASVLVIGEGVVVAYAA